MRKPDPSPHSDIEALRRDAEAILEGAERKEVLASLDDLEKAAAEGERVKAEMHAREAKERTRRRLVALFLSLPVACVPSWIAVSLIGDFKSGMIDAVVFAVEFGLASIAALVFLYTALVPLVTGEDAPVRIFRRRR